MNMTHHLLKIKWLFFLFLGLPLFLFAQKAPEKFGKIDIQDLKTTVCPIDSNAHAYYIFDFGFITFEYEDTKVSLFGSGGSNKGFRLVFERHYRIKILDKIGAEHADFEIPLYMDGKAEEELADIRANTYNDSNNAVESFKLEKNKIIKEKTTKNLMTVKFPMPNVKEGSVIEVSYTIKSDFLYNLQDWYFQHEIPVLYSEYYVRIPEFFRYNQHLTGYVDVNMKKSERTESITLDFYDQIGGYGLQQRAGTQTIKYLEQVYQFTAKDIPAFVSEKYLRTPKNHISTLKFELQSVKMPGSDERSYTTTWEKIRDKLLEHEFFGLELKKTGFLKEEITPILKLNANGVQLIRAAQNFLRSKMSRNDLNSLYVQKSLKDAFKSGSGTTTEINLCLVMILRELGLNADPLILSTQSNGRINRIHPTISDFNCVVAIVELEGKKLLVDASDPFSDINLLPVRCINDFGLVVAPNQIDWIDLERLSSYKAQSVYKLKLNPADLTFTGTLDYNTGEYAAYSRRQKLGISGTKEKQTENLQSQYKGMQIKNSEITNFNNLDEKLKEHYDISINNYPEVAGDLIYFSPMFYETDSENPFKLEKRDYPVEFDFPLVIAKTVIIQIPSDFTIDAIPQSIILSLNNKAAKFTYTVEKIENSIQVSSQFNLNQTQFLPEEYPDLKEFYGQVIAKQNEKIVLKRN